VRTTQLCRPDRAQAQRALLIAPPTALSHHSYHSPLTRHRIVTGGAIAYVKWAHQAGERGPEGRLLHRREDFFTSDLCRGWFKALATKLATRINTITGVAYKDDPTIFAWELCNEPRYQGDSSGDVLQAWTEEMAAHVKSVDPNHMLTVGSEGFYGAASPSRAGDNPISGAAKMGVDFARNFAVRELDFACVHIWADLWLYTGESDKLEFLDRWITGHLEEARDTFDKPVILEEFGKWRPLGVRDVFFERAFAGAVAGPASNVPSHAAGALFWHADPDGYPHDEDGFSVRLPSDSGTAQVVATAADSIRESPGVEGEGARARRSERARTRYRSPSSTRTPSEDAPAAPRYRFPRFRPVSAAGAAEGPNAPRDVAKEEHER
jgi:mannan endo-1,4-beta-mannosidase